jgi:DNA-binding response OmpR family regulator
VASQPRLEPIVVTQVLLIDDNPIQLRVRETILRGAGFQVSIATTAESALALLRIAANKFGVIVTDHVLPGASGADFVRELRRVDPITPVVVVSGMPDVAEEYDGLNAVVRQKPLPPQELIALVRERMPE